MRDIEERIWAYIGGIVRTDKMTALQIGGVDDHIHALVTASAIIAPAQIAQYLKGDSSKWIHDQFRKLRGFGWQDGYGAFTVSKSTFLKSSATFRISAIVIVRRHFKTSTWSSWTNTVLNMMSAIFGAESAVAHATYGIATDFPPALKGRAKIRISLRDKPLRLAERSADVF